MADALASWNDTPTKATIVAFVERVTTGPDAVPPEERIAVFDNDGTLWAEKPMPVELVFILKRWAEMVEADPSLKDRQPWKAAVERDYAFLAGAFDKHYQGDDTDIKVIMAGVIGAFAGMEVEAYGAAAAEFIREGQHPTLKRPFGSVGYQPMIELLRYLEANGFTTFIASGGNRDFMRGFAADMYGLPPERIIGSSNELDLGRGRRRFRGLRGGPRRVRRRRRPSRSASGAASAGGRSSPVATRTATSRCSPSPGRPRDPGSGCSCSTTTPTASSTTSRAPRRRSSGRRSTAGR